MCNILRAKIKIMKKLLLRLIITAGLMTVLTFVLPQDASAASITLSGGCAIDNAILSANNDADTGGCTGTGIYGDDEIIVPAGTWNVGANVSSEGNLTITGAGMGQSIIDAGDAFAGISCNNPTPNSLINFTVSGLLIRNTPSSSGAYPLAVANCSANISEVEITDGQEDANIYFIVNQDLVTAQLNISDVYIHDTLGAGVTVLAAGGAVTNEIGVNIDRLTVYNANSPSKVMGGVSISAGEDQNNSTHTINARIRNSTFTDDSANDSYGIFAVAQSPSSSGSTDELNLTLENVTVVGHSVVGFPASGIVTGAYTGSGSSASVITTVRNTLVADNQANASAVNCAALPFGGGGTETAVITSLGNNIADDASCGFTNTGDQESVSNIMSTLGPLQNNGGSVPTMALLAGSPAIDTGTVISGVTTDQRGVSRPQCAAFDVGAYEYNGVCPVLAEAPLDTGNSETPQGLLADTGDDVRVVLVAVALLFMASIGIYIATRSNRNRVTRA